MNPTFSESIMSNNASGSSSVMPGWSFTRIPRRCWCGKAIALKLSKLKDNPQQRYFRCAHVAADRLSGDKHVFKWMDEAMLNEFDIMENNIASLTTLRMDIENMQRKMENSIFDRVDLVLVEAKNWFKKVVVSLVIFFMIVCISLKFIG